MLKRGRRFAGCKLNEDYLNLAEKRIDERV